MVENFDNDRILLIRTGGTMDAKPYENPRRPPKIVTTLHGEESLIMGVVQSLPHGDLIDGLSWGSWDEKRFVKDSQEYSDADIEALAELIKQDSHRCFLLTHGTSAMKHNAERLQKALAGTDKTVVFAGAMVPFSMADKHPGDGKQALTYALEHIRTQKPGVWMVARSQRTMRLEMLDPSTVVEKNEAQSIKDLCFTVSHR